MGMAFGQQSEKSLLWKISGNGLQEPSYLFGTIHITCDASLSEKVKTALDKTQQLCLELDMDDPNMQAAMMSSMMMKNGVTMKSLSQPEDFKIVDNIVELGFSGFKCYIENKNYKKFGLKKKVFFFYFEILKN